MPPPWIFKYYIGAYVLIGAAVFFIAGGLNPPVRGTDR